MADTYRSVLNTQQPDMASTIWRLSQLLYGTSQLGEALSLRSWLTEHYRAAGDQTNLGNPLGNQAPILRDRGDLDEAMTLHKEEERICRELGEVAGLVTSLGNQAVLMAFNLLRPTDALPLVEEAHQIAIRHGLSALANRIAMLLVEIKQALE
jgi:hypothetical protein